MKQNQKKRKEKFITNVTLLSMAKRQILLITFPSQGLINPTLQFAHRLVRIGVDVIFVVNNFIRRDMTKIPTLEGLTLVEFSDGNDHYYKNGSADERAHFISNFRICGSQALAKLITDSASKGRPIDCLVYTTLLPWAAKVAREHHVPSTLLWAQPATVLDLYYYYFNGFGDMIKTKTKEDGSCSIKLPNLPLPFTSRDLPSFFAPTNTYKLAFQMYQDHIDVLAGKSHQKVLVNTFDALEPEALSAIDGTNMVGIGPLIQSDSSFSAHMHQHSCHEEYIKWLNSKPESSVVYVSFGSIAVLSEQQMKEMERGLLDSGRTFLWVIRAPQNGADNDSAKELEENMIVPWCEQVEVLSHPSVGCFVTHCGWNSTLESLVCGVPMVVFPQWSDQGTNAMMVDDVWKTGVRVVAGEEDGLVDGEEIKRCLEIVMGGGERGEEIRKNAVKWKKLASEAVKEGGSSDMNLRAFVDEIGKII